MVALLVGLAVAVPAHADATSAWLPGPNASGDDTYAGFIDTPLAGATVPNAATVVVKGWVVDRTAEGWSGIDDVHVYAGLADQGGLFLTRGIVGQSRPDVGTALGQPTFGQSGFSAAFPAAQLPTGTSSLTIYVHTPDKGWWYRQIDVKVLAPPSPAFPDDPVLVVRQPGSGSFIQQITPDVLISGYALDRNAAPDAGIAGTGIKQVQVFLDGGRGIGTFLGTADLGHRDREATGFGERFGLAGWQIAVHPGEFSLDKHAFFVYATSAVSSNEAVVVVTFTVT